MEISKLDAWWASLTTSQKERIATKVASRNSDIVTEITYPACTAMWNDLKEEKKQWIHGHCTDKHGYLLPEWKEGQSMSY